MIKKKTKRMVQAFPNDSVKPLRGVVLSTKMDKTAVVKVVRRFKHPLYGKIVQKTKKYKIHDEKNECREGDVVEMLESRPLSKSKHMVLKKIVGH